MRRSGDGVCSVCKKPGLLVEHHINGRRIRNADKEWNLVSICPNCHDSVHATPPRLAIRGWLFSTSGKILDFSWE